MNRVLINSFSISNTTWTAIERICRATDPGRRTTSLRRKRERSRQEPLIQLIEQFHYFEYELPYEAVAEPVWCTDFVLMKIH